MQTAVFSHVEAKQGVTIGTRLDEFVAEAVSADRLGYDYYFTTEHHFSGGFSLAPSQPISLTLLARATERIRFGPMVWILPLADPVRVAEELAILDHLSGGRLEAGFGRGVWGHEKIALGVLPDDDAGRMAEGLEVLQRIWAADGPFSWHGRFYDYFGVEMPYAPLQAPHPPIWLPTSDGVKARSIGADGHATGGFSFVGFDRLIPVADGHRAGWEESGRPPTDRRFCFLAPIIVADTDDEARRLAEVHFSRLSDAFVHPATATIRVAGNAVRARAQRSRANFERMRDDFAWALETFRVVCGSPDTVTEQIQAIKAQLDMTVFIGQFSFGELPIERVIESMELFAAKVAPAIREL